MCAGLLSILLLGVSGQHVEAAEDAETFLYVSTTPAGAEVLVDGKRLGASPDIFRVEPGVRRIVVELDGHDPQGRELAIRAKEITRVVFDLKRATGGTGGPSPDDLNATGPGGDEKRTRNALSMPMTIRFDRSPLKDAIAALSRTLNLAFVIDEEALGEAGIRRDTPISVSLPDMPVGSALTRMLSGKGLVWTTCAGALVITTPEGAKAIPSRRRPRHFVRLVIGKDVMTFQGERTEWGTIDQWLEKVPDHRHTVLEIAKAWGGLPMDECAKRWPDDLCRASTLARYFMFEYVRDVGLQPAGSRGSPPQMVLEGEVRPDEQPVWVHLHRPGGPMPSSAGWVHDLATGKTLGPSSDGIVMNHRDCTRLGKGDLASDGPETFSCLRGATAESVETTPGGVKKILLIKAEQPHEKVITYVMPHLPCFLLVTTAENERFEVTVLSVSQDGGLNFNYKPAEPAVAPQAQPAARPETAVPRYPARRVFLPDARGRGEQSVLDLASGETLPCSEEAARDPGWFTRMRKGDLMYEDVLYCLRGGRAQCLEGDPFLAVRVEGDVTSYKLPKVPCRLHVTTAEKQHFGVTVLSVTKGKRAGIDLEYYPADPSLVPRAEGFGSRRRPAE